MRRKTLTNLLGMALTTIGFAGCCENPQHAIVDGTVVKTHYVPRVVSAWDPRPPQYFVKVETQDGIEPVRFCKFISADLAKVTFDKGDNIRVRVLKGGCKGWDNEAYKINP